MKQTNLEQAQQSLFFLSLQLTTATLVTTWLLFQVITAIKTYLPRLLRVQSLQATLSGVLYSFILFFIFSIFGSVYEIISTKELTHEKVARIFLLFICGVGLYVFSELLMSFLQVRGLL